MDSPPIITSNVVENEYSAVSISAKLIIVF